MLFNSGVFAIFFAVFFPLFLLCRKNVLARNALLLVASYVFYGWWDVRFLVLIAVSTAVDYLSGLGSAGDTVTNRDRFKASAFLALATLVCLSFAQGDDLWIIPAVVATMAVVLLLSVIVQRAAVENRRRYWLYMSIGCNLGILGFFKYFNFFVQSAIEGINAIGIETSTVTLSIILPVGLSFYTFQGISRTVDIYRGLVPGTRSLITLASYLAFFPQLVAGPIERVRNLMPQFEMVRTLNARMISSGARLFLWGLFMKLVVADNVAPISDAIFNAPAGHSGGATLAGIVAFTFQIYCDFAGYSNMARGVARVLGFELMVNFNLPYFSRTPSEFWQRWHISLSSWLRDYLYISLGGNRGGPVKTYRNLLLTMLLGGLWHGASWTFIVWGAFHGGILVLYRVLGIDALMERVKMTSARGISINVIAWFAMFCLVMAGWVFFRARTFDDAMAVFANLGDLSGYSFETFEPVLRFVIPLVLVEIYMRAARQLEVLDVGPFLVRYSTTVLAFMAVLTLAAKGGREFIYFDF